MPDVSREGARSREDFSLVLGGPLYQVLLRYRLARPSLELLRRRIGAVVLVTWLPLLVLSALAGKLFGGVEVPLFRDPSTHVRLLLALPLLIWAEVVVHRSLREVVQQFTDRRLIAPEDQPRFERAVASAGRWRNSVTAEVVMLVLSFTLGYWAWSRAAALSVPTWYGRGDVGGVRQLTLAGFWLAFISLPIFRFILVRWYFRIVIWYRFLWTISRLDLRLNPLHPDRCGGLGFLALSSAAFVPVLVAHSVLFAGILGDWIWNERAKLTDYDAQIGLLVVCLILIALAPLCFFAGQLHRARQSGLRRYGLLASRYVDDFQSKWIPDGAPAGTSPLGAADIQSLADLGKSFEVVREMRLLPFGKETVIRLAIVNLVPIAPLVLTMIPFRDLIGELLKMAV